MKTFKERVHEVLCEYPFPHPTDRGVMQDRLSSILAEADSLRSEVRRLKAYLRTCEEMSLEYENQRSDAVASCQEVIANLIAERDALKNEIADAEHYSWEQSREHDEMIAGDR